MFMEEMKHFVAMARGEVESSCALEDGIRVMKLSSAIYRSQKLGRVIEL
jgi:predicted dehydrogenase